MNYSLVFENFLYWIELNYLLALFLFFIFILFYSLFSIPGLIPFFVFSGYIFGILLSYLTCILAFTIGCFFFFIISKFFLNKFFRKYYIKYSDKINYYIKNSTIEYLIIFRLIPGTPLFVQNIILSLLEISSFKFLISTFIGSTPLMFFCIYLGNKLKNVINVKSITISDIFTLDFFLISLAIVILIIVRIYFKRKAIIQ